MNLFTWGCQVLWFFYILHREICLMNDNYMLFHCLKEWKGKKTKTKNQHCLDFYYFSSSRLVMESRNIDPDSVTLVETSLKLLLPFSPLEGLKGHLFYVTNLSPIYAQLTLATLAAGGGGWIWTSCHGCQVGRSWGVCAQHVLKSSLSSLFAQMKPGGHVQWHGFWWVLTWKPTTAGHGEVPLCFNLASWRGHSLGGWAVLF